MFEYKGKMVSDAGFYIKGKTISGFSVPKNNEPKEEIKLDLNTLKISKGFISCNNIIIMRFHPDWTYADYKTAWVKARYTNDDQIAIMLNKDNSNEDLEMYNKMQDWRNWCSEISHKILEKAGQ